MGTRMRGGRRRRSGRRGARWRERTRCRARERRSFSLADIWAVAVAVAGPFTSRRRDSARTDKGRRPAARASNSHETSALIRRDAFSSCTRAEGMPAAQPRSRGPAKALPYARPASLGRTRHDAVNAHGLTASQPRIPMPRELRRARWKRETRRNGPLARLEGRQSERSRARRARELPTQTSAGAHGRGPRTPSVSLERFCSAQFQGPRLPPSPTMAGTTPAPRRRVGVDPRCRLPDCGEIRYDPFRAGFVASLSLRGPRD